MSLSAIIASKNERDAGSSRIIRPLTVEKGGYQVLSEGVLPSSEGISGADRVASPEVTEVEASAKKRISDALSLVASYIPTEIVALYTVVLATLRSETEFGLHVGVFWGFLVGTPIVVWLVYAVSQVEGKKAIPWKPKEWPLWEMIAATVAFVAWSAAMPGGAFIRYSWYDSRIFGIVLVGVSLFLPMIGVLVTGRKRKTDQ